METSTRYKCAQLLLMVREHMRIARPVNESEILDKMEAFLRFPLLAPDFHECSECSDQPCSCCNNAPKQGEWNLTAGSPIEARLRNQDWDGNTGTWVRSFENGQHLFIPDVEPRRYQLADEIRPLEKSLDEKILQIIKEESERSNVRQYTCVNGFGYSQFERNIAERIKSLFKFT